MTALRACLFSFTVAVASASSVGCVFPLRDVIRAEASALAEMAETRSVFVAATAGDGYGTQSAPVPRIHDGIRLAEEILSNDSEPLTIYVATGTYVVDDTIVVPRSVVLTGGYSPATWASEPEAATVIRTTGFPGVSFETNADARTGLEHVTLIVESGTEVRGVECINSSPTIRNVVVNVRAATETAIGILADGSDCLLDATRIHFGSVTQTAWGLAVIASTPVVRNTVVSGTFSGTAVAVHVTRGSTVSFLNNTVFVPGGDRDMALFVSGSTIRLENNIFSAFWACRGIAESDSGAVFTHVRNNEFFHTASPILLRSDGSEISVIADLETALGPAASGNDAGTDPLFANTALDDFHLGQNPIAGLDLSDEFATDADGLERTVPWSVGAFERD